MHKIFTNTLFIGKEVHYLPSCHSTNDIAAELMTKKGLNEGAVVITDRQTAGRGQRGNNWEAEPHQNLTFSIVLEPHSLDISEQYLLNISISLALHDFLSQYLQEGLRIKWPNDIYGYDNKLGGILIENFIKKGQIEYTIVGIGLNINQKNFLFGKATSLSNECGQNFNLDELLPLLFSHLERRYMQLRKVVYSQLVDEYHSKLYWINERRTFKADDFFEGTIRGIDASGRLAIVIDGKTEHFHVKEVQFIG